MAPPVDMEFYELLGVSPLHSLDPGESPDALKRIEQVTDFQSELAKSFRTKALLVHTDRDDGGNKEEFERLQLAFFSLFVCVIRDKYNEKGEGGIPKVEGAASGAFAWMVEESTCEKTDDTEDDLSQMEIDVDEDSVTPVADENSKLAAEINRKRIEEKKHYDAWVDSMGAQSILEEVLISVKEGNERRKKKNYS